MSTAPSTSTSTWPIIRELDARPWTWLALGLLTTATGHMRWGVDVLAFLAPIAWLRYLSLTPSRRTRLGFFVAYLVAWIIVVAGIVTAPIPMALALGFGLVIAAMLAGPYLLWSWQLERVGQRSAWTTILFPAAMVVAETLAHRVTPFGVWGHAANTALSDLPLMQLAALTGASGIGFVIHWLAAALEARSSAIGHMRGHRRQLWLASAALIGAHVYGDIRLDIEANRETETVKLAAVGTDCDLSGLPIPEPEQRAAWDVALFERTRIAAAGGAELVVWTEAAAVVERDEEEQWLDAVGELARELDVAIVAGYVVPLGGDEDFRYDNAYALFRPDGGLEHRYLKHHPVPGEPATVGTGDAPMWTSETLGQVSGAICYDYDFPSSAVERAGADLVALPSSDWRGIDPIHTHMARLRAIEGGHALLRSTRYGLSAGIDALGVVHGQLSAFDDDERILMVDLPRHGRRTVYATLGEWFALLCGLLTALALFMTPRPV